jgi:hypothetical protein
MLLLNVHFFYTDYTLAITPVSSTDRNRYRSSLSSRHHRLIYCVKIYFHQHIIGISSAYHRGRRHHHRRSCVEVEMKLF